MRRSVKDVDLQAYKDFHASQQKAKQQAGDLPGEKFQWPDNSSILDDKPESGGADDGLYASNQGQAAANPDDDLYAS